MTEFEGDEERFEAMAAELDRYADVPDDVLWRVVTRDGACMATAAEGDGPEWIGTASDDRELAASICAGCPVRRACLEAELRTAGAATVGVWGAINDADRRALLPVWLSRRERQGGGENDGT
ncbi:WhiB family redox-sensing transcriptional regulator [Actinoalloteichus hoggarensis]|uniref:WhiB family transcriptional regulator n=1 Tax=Actinoalloteichus hoggarensis TaxID=1470176 RepID=UPI0017E75C9F|nr:WhiB family transcriptional regulator [Actinoalloteichus hoggarensis]MBB5922552.1 WhiB family redox-sensing transcriptional regulator [Actinoalloteichus hoggarensis]